MRIVSTALMVLLLSACGKPSWRGQTTQEEPAPQLPSPPAKPPLEEEPRPTKNLAAEKLLEAVKAGDLSNIPKLLEDACGKDPNCTNLQQSLKKSKDPEIQALLKRMQWKTSLPNLQDALNSPMIRIQSAITEHIQHPKTPVPESQQEILTEIGKIARQHGAQLMDYAKPLVTQGAKQLKDALLDTSREILTGAPGAVWEGVKTVFAPVTEWVSQSYQSFTSWSGRLVEGFGGEQVQEPEPEPSPPPPPLEELKQTVEDRYVEKYRAELIKYRDGQLMNALKEYHTPDWSWLIEAVDDKQKESDRWQGLEPGHVLMALPPPTEDKILAQANEILVANLAQGKTLEKASQKALKPIIILGLEKLLRAIHQGDGYQAVGLVNKLCADSSKCPAFNLMKDPEFLGVLESNSGWFKARHVAISQTVNQLVAKYREILDLDKSNLQSIPQSP